MSKTITFLIGNGLGKALDPSYFDLKQGMKQGWTLTKSKKIKKLIEDSLGKAKPRTEKDLERIQDCFLKLQSIEYQIKNLPNALKKSLEFHINKDTERYFNYLFNVSSYFYHYPLENTAQETLTKFNNFIDNFCSYIKARKAIKDTVHVATLNYDGLLYKSFLDKKRFPIRTGILDGFSGCLVDAITDDGFDKSHLQQRYEKNFGWYLHLHGSPLFYSEYNRIKKNTYNQSTSSFEPVLYKPGRKHIVLCHPKQKYETIQYSEILKEYLEHFKVAISHTDYLIILGYGGEDTHINAIIKSSLKSEGIIFAIERLAEGSFEDRSIFWKHRLCANGTKLKLIQKASILDFNFGCKTWSTTTP